MTYRLVQNDDEQRAGSSHRRSSAWLRKSRNRRRARRGVSVLPTLFTLGNLLCGFGAIFLAGRSTVTSATPHEWSAVTYAVLLIFLGMLLDGLDGHIARLTRSASDLGEQLDSMADMVTFGVAPAFVALQLIDIQAPWSGNPQRDFYFDRFVVIVAFIYVACAGLRLARYNIESNNGAEKDSRSFSGLPSPGAAGTVVSMVLLHEHFLAHDPSWRWLVPSTELAVVFVTLLTALAMVSRLRYMHVANRFLRQRAPFEYVVAIVLVGLLSWIHFQGALATALTVYALSAPVTTIWRKCRPKPSKTVKSSHKQTDTSPAASRPHNQDAVSRR